jgi:GAF domain-containing protein
MRSDTSTVGADRSVEVQRRELAEARQQQAATADVLKAISRSAFDLQAVLYTLVQSAANLCRCDDATIFRVEGETLARVASCGRMKGPSGYVIPAISGTVTGRSVIERRPIHVADLQTETEAYPEGSAIAREFGHRTILAVPLVREGTALGVISLRRNRNEPFSERQMALVTTFADQAVIAIENARLFEAEQASKCELQESLQHQIATSDVLSVISKSPHALQPVLDAIIETAARRCRADYARFLLLRDGAYHVLAHLDRNPNSPERHIPIRPGRDSVVGRVAIERRTIQIPDVRTDPTVSYAANRQIAARTILGVPLVKHGEVVGIIMLFRDAPRPFSGRQVTLVETFANRALIAIENTRLFEAEQARTRELTERTDELTETLEYQTTTGDVLSVISRSPAQVQPVFDTIAQTARRLCEAERASIWQFDGEVYRIVAVDGRRHGEFEGQLPQVRLGIDRASITGRVAIEKRVVHVLDLQADPELTVWKGTHIGSYADFRRTMLGVPLLSHATVVGVIILARCEVKKFTKRQIDLVSTFADQPVIAIENARLFEAEQASKRIGSLGRGTRIAWQGKPSRQLIARTRQSITHHSRTCLRHVVCRRRHRVCI